MEGKFCENAIAINLDALMLDNAIERLSKTLNRNERRKIKNEIQRYRHNLNISRFTVFELEIRQRIKNIRINIRTKLINLLYEKKLLGINRKCWADLVMYEMGYTEWDNVGEATKCGYCGSCMNK